MNGDALQTAGKLTLIIGLLIVVGYNGWLIMEAKGAIGKEPTVNSLEAHFARRDWEHRKRILDARAAKAGKQMTLWGAVVGAAGIILIVVGTQMDPKAG